MIDKIKQFLSFAKTNYKMLIAMALVLVILILFIIVKNTMAKNKKIKAEKEAIETTNDNLKETLQKYEAAAADTAEKKAETRENIQNFTSNDNVTNFNNSINFLHNNRKNKSDK